MNVIQRPVMPAILAATLLTAPISVAAETKLVASSWVPPHHVLVTDLLTPWSKAVEEATEGRVKVSVLPKAVGSPGAHVDAVRDGLADVGFTIHGYVPGRFTLTKLVELPFVGGAAEPTSVAYQRVHDRMLAKADEHKGVKVLAVFAHGPGVVMTTRKPIRALSDFDGLVFRVGGGVSADLAKAVGLNALVKPASESYELLSAGVVDGVLFPGAGITDFKLEKVIRHVTDVPGGLYNTSFVFMMNPAKFAALSKADQDAIDRISGEATARMIGRGMDQRDDKGMAAAKTAGIDVVKASPEMVAAMKAKAGPIIDAWIKEAGEKGVDGKAALAAFEAELAKVAASR